ncbi:MAG: hypothetical protein KKH61_19870, partial [Gammaproteobacteria bacterium]|nr:hypothetical protein [Gammaproteobacteria bacterium]
LYYDNAAKLATSATGVLPSADNTDDLGSAAASWDSLWIHVAAVVGDIPFLDAEDDVAAICAIRGSGEYDAKGRELVDDSTLPKSIMVTYLEDVPARIDTTWIERQVKVDSTLAKYEVPIDSLGEVGAAEEVYEYAYETERTVDTIAPVPAHKKGDLIIGASGKPYFDPAAAIGQLQGAVRQLKARDDSLSAVISSLKVRIEVLEKR